MKMEINGHSFFNGNLASEEKDVEDETSLLDEEILAEDNEWNQFDEIVGCIEDIVIEKQFQDLQESFLEKHYHHFDIGTEENKLIYMELFQVSFITLTVHLTELWNIVIVFVFQEYTKMLEEFIEGELEQRVENFCMKDFIKGKTEIKRKTHC